MDLDKHKSRIEIIEELRSLRRETVQIKRRLSQMEQKDVDWKYADVIIDNSPAILFRRFAAEDLKQRKMVYVSSNISRFGYSAEDFMNNQIMFRDIVYSQDTERTKKEIQDFVNKNIEEYTQTYRIVTRDGDVRWIEDRTSVIDDPETGNRYHQGIVIDIHRRKEAEEKLRRSEEKYRRIVETTSEGFLLMDKNLIIVDMNNAYCRMTGYSKKELVGKSLIDLATEKYRIFLSANRDDLLNRQHYKFENDLISGSGAIVPVLVHGNTLYDDSGSIIGNMAFVTDMTEHKKALILAGEVQKSLLPQKVPQLQGLDISGKNISCDEIGGDYYDFLFRSDTSKGPFSVVVGDISGHGVDSALLMTTARAFLRMRASQPGTIIDIVTAMNRHLTEDVFETGKFMTLFYITIDDSRRRIEWIRAGHEPAWLYDPDENSFEELKGPGIALGIDKKYVYQPNLKCGLKKDQVIIVGTDGIWEGHNKAGEMFGKKRLHRIISQNASFSAEIILNAVFQEHYNFTQDAQSEDDLTLVVIKITQ